MNSANKLTFRQREGIEPLPAPLEKENLTPKLRNAIWNAIYYSINDDLIDEWFDILFSYHCDVLYERVDSFLYFVTGSISENIVVEVHHVEKYVSDIVANEDIDWYVWIEFFEHVIQHENCPSNLDKKINLALQKFLYPYKIINKMFVPVSSKEEGETIENAFTKLWENRLGGAEKHLTSSIEHLKQGKYRDSIRESIHAVESVASIIAGQKKAALRDALKVLKNKSVIEDSELTKSFEKLYDYTNDAKGGIRHALLSEQSNAGADEAQFMLGACASFVSYLINKANKAKININ